MSYKSVLVNLDIDAPLAPVVMAAADLAERLGAKLIGFCAADAPIPITGPGGEVLAAEAWQQMRSDIEGKFKELHDEFGKMFAGRIPTEWCQALDNPSRALALRSRIADLIIMSAPEGVAAGHAYRQADPGSVVLQAGRPLLLLARGTEQVQMKDVVIAWKDTREARRAVADAVPLLRLALNVTVVTVAAERGQWVDQSVADIVGFLARHGVEARSKVLENSDDSGRLVEFIVANHVDLVVSGAYGHSRLREWAFGGMTRSLLDETGLNRLMSS